MLPNKIMSSNPSPFTNDDILFDLREAKITPRHENYELEVQSYVPIGGEGWGISPP